MTTILVVHGAVALVAYSLLLWDAFRRARLEREAAALLRRVEGATPPASAHPVMDLSLCLGCRTCVSVCFERDALVIFEGHARLGDPAACAGDGACAHACPAGSITIVPVASVTATIVRAPARRKAIPPLEDPGGAGLTYSIDSAVCSGCGLCVKTCPSDAIVGEPRQPHRVVADKCTRCDQCRQTCNLQAIRAGPPRCG